MKRKLLFGLVLFSFLFINVYALTDGESATGVVKVGDVDASVYNVEVTWGKMEFTYSEQINYVWDEDNHIYELGLSTYNWVAEDNYIDVVNKSYEAIDVELEYISLKDSVDGVFDVSNKSIESNGNSRFTLVLNGKLDSSSKVGTINLKIS